MYLFGVYDCVKEEMGPPFVAKNLNDAKRTFKRLFEGQNNLDPDEFNLWCLCGFSSEAVDEYNSAFIFDPRRGEKCHILGFSVDKIGVDMAEKLNSEELV